MSALIHLLYSRVHTNQVGINNNYKISVCGREPEDIRIEGQSVILSQNTGITNICFTRMPETITNYQDCEDLLTCFIILGWYYTLKDDSKFHICVLKNICEEFIVPKNSEELPGEYKIKGDIDNISPENIDIIDYNSLISTYKHKLNELIEALQMNIEINFTSNEDFTHFLDYCRDNSSVRNLDGIKAFLFNYLIKNVSVDDLETPPVSPINQSSPGSPGSPGTLGSPGSPGSPGNFLQQEFLKAIGSPNIANSEMTIGDIQEFRATYNNPQPMYTAPFDLDLNFLDPTKYFQQPMTQQEFMAEFPQNPFANLPSPQEFQIGNLGNIEFSNITPIHGSIFDPNSY